MGSQRGPHAGHGPKEGKGLAEMALGPQGQSGSLNRTLPLARWTCNTCHHKASPSSDPTKLFPG